MSTEPGGALERALDDAVARHPAARRGLGFQRVELRGPIEVGATVVPPVHVLECLACGTLLRVGSPHLLAHHRGHRSFSLARWVRRTISRVDRRVRALL